MVRVAALAKTKRNRLASVYWALAGLWIAFVGIGFAWAWKAGLP